MTSHKCSIYYSHLSSIRPFRHHHFTLTLCAHLLQLYRGWVDEGWWLVYCARGGG